MRGARWRLAGCSGLVPAWYIKPLESKGMEAEESMGFLERAADRWEAGKTMAGAGLGERGKGGE